MNKLIIKNVAILVVLLIISLMIDILQIKYEVISKKTGKFLYNLIYPISYFSFLLINLSLREKVANKYLGFLFIIVIALIISLLFWFITFTIGVNFRISLGGGV